MKGRFIAVFAAGLIMGLLGGAYAYHRWVAPQIYWMADMGNMGLIYEYAQIQYREGTYEAAAKALSTELAAMERQKQLDKGPCDDPRLAAYDKLMVSLRLAVLHERAGKAKEAQEAWAKAQTYAQLAGWKDTSVDHLRSVLQRMENPSKTKGH